jgi:hypothetical protein
MAKFYKAVQGVDDIPRFKFSNWWNGFEKAVWPQSSTPETRYEHMDEHTVWLTALLADTDKGNKAGAR